MDIGGTKRLAPWIILIWAIQWMVVLCTNKEETFVGETQIKVRDDFRFGFWSTRKTIKWRLSTKLNILISGSSEWFGLEIKNQGILSLWKYTTLGVQSQKCRLAVIIYGTILIFMADMSSNSLSISHISGQLSMSKLSFSSVQLLSRVRLFETPWTAARQASLSITNSWSLLKLMSTESVIPSNHLILCCPLLLLPSIFPASGSFQISQFFASGGQSIGVSASPSVLPKNTQDWFPLNGLVGSPCCPGDSPESSTTPRFKSINSSALSKSIHDHWKNQSFEMDLCWQSNVLLFNMLSRLVITFHYCIYKKKKSVGPRIDKNS